MEKGNGQDQTAQQPAGQPAGQPPTDQQPAGKPPAGQPPTDSGGSAPVAPSGGGGSQADQSGPKDREAAQSGPPRREVLWQGPHEAGHPDGSTLSLDGKGGATFTDGQNTARLDGDQWVDARTGKPAGRGITAKADHRLRSEEVKRGLRQSMR
jgi:hypothetical protein